jgi:hypothetical protein
MSKKNKTPRVTRRERRAASVSALTASLAVPASVESGRVVTTESLGLRKMSDVLEEFVAPIVDTFPRDADHATIERVYTLGAAVWNATSEGAPPEQLSEIVGMLGAGAGGEDEGVAEQIVAVLARQRKERFADDRRVIVDVKMAWDRGQLQLAVASIVPG